MRILKYILLSSILFALPSAAQEQENRTDEEKVEKNYSMFSFNGIEVSADIFGYAYSLLGEYTSGEVALEVNIGNRFYPAVEVGYGWCSTTDETTGIRYKASAPYYKVGIDYNFSTTKEKPDPDYSILGIARFGWTSFEYDVTAPPVTDPVWGGTSSLELNGVKGNAAWAEIGVGLKARIAKNFLMGWSVRYKIRISEKVGSNSNMWYVPGYGINSSTCFGGTYSLIYEIPFK
jgi:hypothetical protein